VDSLYSSPAFVLSYAIHVLPITLLSLLLFSGFGYWALGLNPEFTRYLIFIACAFILNLMGEFIAMMSLAFIFDRNRASSASFLLISVSALMGTGFLRSAETMPVFFQYLRYGTVFRYASEILNANEFAGLQFTCNPILPCEYPTGDAFLEEMYPNAADSMGINFGALIFMTVMLLVTQIVIFHFIKRSLR